MILFEFPDKEIVLKDIKSHTNGEALTVGEYVIWTVRNNISMDFLNLIYQVKSVLELHLTDSQWSDILKFNEFDLILCRYAILYWV